jgi:hypothetical protein
MMNHYETVFPLLSPHVTYLPIPAFVQLQLVPIETLVDYNTGKFN